MGLDPAELHRELVAPTTRWDVSVAIHRGCGGPRHGVLKMRAAFAVSEMLAGHARRFVCDMPVAKACPDVSLWRGGTAVLVLDVLSAANRARVLGEGFRSYRMQEGLHHVLLVDSERSHILHAARTPAGWVLRDLPGTGVVELLGIGTLNVDPFAREPYLA